MKCFNINSRVKVRLTKFSKELHKRDGKISGGLDWMSFLILQQKLTLIDTANFKCGI
jgi:hypothetical protein